MRTYTLLLFLFFSSALIGQEAIKLMEQGFTEEVTVDLRNPLFSDGILTTEEGGVAKGPNFRLQALKIKYTKKEEQTTVEAEEQLIVEFGEYVFVGDRIFYDFQKKEGVIFNGRTGIEPWYIGGERIELRPDGTYYIYNGFFTTSENVDPEWVILAQEAVIEEKQYFKAQRVHLKLGMFSVL
jgi:lipopolysaccharide assembly outer membrane protein LptD (OstA)